MLFSEIVLIVIGLGLFETVSSIDNAVINAEILNTMSAKSRKWFLTWGLLFAVFALRGLLPWTIVWATMPSLGPVGALTATFSGDPGVAKAIEASSPILLVGGGTFLVLLFFHWLFLESKEYGLPGEKFFHSKGVWFFSAASFFLSTIVWFSLHLKAIMAFGAAVGSTAFFVIHGFREFAEKEEEELVHGKKGHSDLSKILYLELIDASFSIDGVVGAFAFTLSVPLIILGNGLGALMVRQLTMGNIDRIKKYAYLKNGAMYSILILGTVMVLDGFGFHIPSWFSPLATLAIISLFLAKSIRKNTAKVASLSN